MPELKKQCTQKYQIWVAFLMGMVVIVIAIVIFDTVLGVGHIRAAARPTSETTATKQVSLLSLRKTPGVWLGIDAVDLPRDTLARLGLDLKGAVLVSKVVPGSPAAQYGMLRGDIICEFDHRNVQSITDLVAAMRKVDADERVKVVIYRSGDREVLFVKVAASVTPTTATYRTIAGNTSDQGWGIVVSELTDGLRQANNLNRDDKGVLVVMVKSGSAAERAGVRKGDLVTQVNRTPVTGLADFFAALKSTSRHVLLGVSRNGSIILIHVVAVSPFSTTGGNSESEDDDEGGYKGKPESIPPMGKPGSTSSLLPLPGLDAGAPAALSLDAVGDARRAATIPTVVAPGADNTRGRRRG